MSRRSTTTGDINISDQLVSMGFTLGSVQRAFTQNRNFSQQNESHYIQRLVTWLIDHPSSDDDGDDDDDDEDDEDDDEMLGNNEHVRNLVFYTKRLCSYSRYFQ